MSELQKQLDQTVERSINEAKIGSIDLVLLLGTLAEGWVYFNLFSFTGRASDYIVGGLMFASSIIGLTSATNRFIQMNRYDNECFEIGQRVKAENQLANSNT